MTPIRVLTGKQGGLSGLLDELGALHAQGQTGVLGIIFETEGSTYQKSGAIVLMDAAGMIHGAVSGGCLEPEVEERARCVLRSGHAETVEFDTRSDEDLIFGSGTGCRGRTHLLLLPQRPDAPLTRALTALVTYGGTLEVGLAVSEGESGAGCAKLREQLWIWDRAGEPASSNRDATSVAVQVCAPPRILLLGAGPETATLNAFAWHLGWWLEVAEHRGRWSKFAHAAGIDRLVELPPDEAKEVWWKQNIDAAVVMTHNYALDMQHLSFCAQTELSYVGLLGPAARRDAILEAVGPDVSSALHGRLHAPVGLPMGGVGPESLALSIIAGLEQHFGRRLRARRSETPLRRAPAVTAVDQDY